MNKAEIFKKLRLNVSQKILILNAPVDYKELLVGMSYDSEPGIHKEYYDFIQIFSERQEELESLMKSVDACRKYDCLLWACYPKGTGKIKSDIKRDTIWKAFELIGVCAVTQIAIDETWSALRGRPLDAVGK